MTGKQEQGRQAWLGPSLGHRGVRHTHSRRVWARGGSELKLLKLVFSSFLHFTSGIIACSLATWTNEIDSGGMAVTKAVKILALSKKGGLPIPKDAQSDN